MVPREPRAVLHWTQSAQPPLRALLCHPQGTRKSSSVETVSMHTFGRMSTEELQIVKKQKGGRDGVNGKLTMNGNDDS